MSAALATPSSPSRRRKGPRPMDASAQAVVTKHLPLVHSIAGRMKRQELTGAAMEDLVQWGTLGLIDAVLAFDPGRGWQLSTFACHRIRGAMLDGAREELGGGRYNHHLLKRRRQDRVTDEAVLVRVSSTVPAPDEVIEGRQRAVAVRRAVAQLPQLERALIERGDLGGEMFKDVSAQSGLSKSWASRVRSAALDALRVDLAEVWF